jgi:hypothetical protein
MKESDIMGALFELHQAGMEVEIVDVLKVQFIQKMNYLTI